MAKLRLLLLSFLITLPLYAVSLEAVMIEQAGHHELIEMATLRGIPYEGRSDSELKALMGGKAPSFESEAEKWKLEVLKSGYMRSSDDFLTLTGGVDVIFTPSGGTASTIQSSSMVVDSPHTTFLALGDVSYSGEKSALAQVTGDAVSMNWENEKLTLSGGVTESLRENSESQSISFYTTGERILYDSPARAIFFDEGYITNNPRHAYSSITAKKLVVTESGDMFIKGALLKIGRVPVLYLPVFLFPGTRMMGNPAIGTERSRGWFVNTTWELFGKDPGIKSGEESSFSSLLKDSSGTDLARDGVIYIGSGESTLSPLQAWAGRTSSYLSLMFDTYQKRGFLFGIRGDVNVKPVQISGDFRMAVDPEGESELTRWSSYPTFRWGGESELELSGRIGKVKLKLPFYSDPFFKRDYWDRFTSFSLDYLWGATWPEEFRRSYTRYNLLLDGSLDIPVRALSPYVDSLSITDISAEAEYHWRRRDGRYAYRIEKVELPVFKFKASGQLFDFSSSAEQQSDPYGLQSTLIGYKSYRKNYSRLKWNLSQSYSQSAESGSGGFDWHNNRTHYSRSEGNLEWENSFGGVKLNQSFLTDYTVDVDRQVGRYRKDSLSLTGESRVDIPALGFTYYLKEQLYQRERDWFDNGTRVDKITPWGFDKERVKSHYVKLSATRGIGTLSVKYTLPPLTQAILPSVSVKAGHSLFSFSWNFKQKQERLQRDKVDFGYEWKSSLFRFSYRLDFQSDPALERGMRHRQDAELKLGRWTLSQDLDWRESTGEFEQVAFNLSGPLFSTGYYLRGDLEPWKWVFRLNTGDFGFRFRKNRWHVKMRGDLTYSGNFETAASSYLTFSGGVGLSIAQLLDLQLTMTMANTGFYTYYRDGSFSLSAMLEDLWRSFDIIGGGNRRTRFNLSDISFALVHYMDDWTLNCKYGGSVVLSNHRYEWVPVFSVFLQWKTIPELKVDQNWKRGERGWHNTGARET